MQQLSFNLTPRKRGGARPGAGRKKSPRAGPPHLKRERLVRRHPVHVTTRFARALPSMREEVLARAIMAQIRRANSRFWRIVQFSIQATHLHLLVEIENETELGRAVKGLGVRVAKSVNRVLRRKGQRGLRTVPCSSTSHPARDAPCPRLRYLQRPQAPRDLLGVGPVVFSRLVCRLVPAAWGRGRSIPRTGAHSRGARANMAPLYRVEARWADRRAPAKIVGSFEAGARDPRRHRRDSQLAHSRATVAGSSGLPTREVGQGLEPLDGREPRR